MKVCSTIPTVLRANLEGTASEPQANLEGTTSELNQKYVNFLLLPTVARRLQVLLESCVNGYHAYGYLL